MLTTPTCDCKRGYRRGEIVWVHHASVDCPGNQPPPPPPARPERTEYDVHQQLRRVFRQLKDDLRDADGNLDAPSTRDWPRLSAIVAAELSIGEQLQLLLGRAAGLVARGYLAAEPLRRRVRTLLLESTGFTAPVTTAATPITPPKAVGLALERLRPVTPFGAALATPQPGDTPAITSDRWRVSLWAAEIAD